MVKRCVPFLFSCFCKERRTKSTLRRAEHTEQTIKLYASRKRENGMEEFASFSETLQVASAALVRFN